MRKWPLGIFGLILTMAIALLGACTLGEPPWRDDSISVGRLFVTPVGKPVSIQAIRNGRIEKRLPFEIIATARQNGDVQLLAMRYRGAVVVRSPHERRREIFQCKEVYAVALSPNGHKGACAKMDGHVAIFDVQNAKTQIIDITDRAPNNGEPEVAFLSNTLLGIIVRDRSCPINHAMFITPARVVVYDLAGRELERRVCADGIVVGDHRIAYLGFDLSGKAIYSTNGESWFDGRPETFTDRDILLLRDRSIRLVTEGGSLVRNDVLRASWGP